MTFPLSIFSVNLLSDNLLLLASLLVFAAILITKLGTRIGTPTLLLFLLLGMLAGEDGLGLEFEDFELAESIGHFAICRRTGDLSGGDQACDETGYTAFYLGCFPDSRPYRFVHLLPGRQLHRSTGFIIPELLPSCGGYVLYGFGIGVLSAEGQENASEAESGPASGT